MKIFPLSLAFWNCIPIIIGHNYDQLQVVWGSQAAAEDSLLGDTVLVATHSRTVYQLPFIQPLMSAGYTPMATVL